MDIRQGKKATGITGGTSGSFEKAAYSIAEFAKITGVSPWSVRMAVRDGDLRHIRWGRRVLIPANEVQRLFG